MELKTNEAAALVTALSTALVLVLIRLKESVEDRLFIRKLLRSGKVELHDSSEYRLLAAFRSRSKKDVVILLPAFIWFLLCLAIPDVAPLFIKERECASFGRLAIVRARAKGTDGRSNLGAGDLFAATASRLVERRIQAGGTILRGPLLYSDVRNYVIENDERRLLDWSWELKGPVKTFKAKAVMFVPISRSYADSAFAIQDTEPGGLEIDENRTASFVKAFDDVDRVISWPRYGVEKRSENGTDHLSFVRFDIEGKTRLSAGINPLGDTTVEVVNVTLTRGTELGANQFLIRTCYYAVVQDTTLEGRGLAGVAEAAMMCHFLAMSAASPAPFEQREVTTFKTCSSYETTALALTIALAIVIFILAILHFSASTKTRGLHGVASRRRICDFLCREKECTVQGVQDEVLRSCSKLIVADEGSHYRVRFANSSNAFGQPVIEDKPILGARSEWQWRRSPCFETQRIGEGGTRDTDDDSTKNPF